MNHLHNVKFEKKIINNSQQNMQFENIFYRVRCWKELPMEKQLK